MQVKSRAVPCVLRSKFGATLGVERNRVSKEALQLLEGYQKARVFTDRNLKGNFKIKDNELNMAIINQIINKKSSLRYKLDQEVRQIQTRRKHAC